MLSSVTRQCRPFHRIALLNYSLLYCTMGPVLPCMDPILLIAKLMPQPIKDVLHVGKGVRVKIPPQL